MLLQKSEIYSYVLTDILEAEKLLAESNNYLSEARLARVAVVIPTYNEKDNIEKITSAIFGILPQAEIVIVDDASPDGTGIIGERLLSQNDHIHVIHRTGKRGLGLAYIDGFKFVLNNLDSEYIFEMDADFSHNPQYLPIFLHYAQKYKLVTGSRFLRRVTIKNRPLWRNIISKITRWFVNILTGIKLTDVTTGFKCFRRSLLEKIDLDKIESTGYAFQIEVSYFVRKLDTHIKEIPILFLKRTADASKMSTRIMLEGIYLVLKLSLQRLRRMR